MAFDPIRKPSERIAADFSFGNRPIRRLVLTNRAAYWSGSTVLGFGITTERVPLSQVISVVIREEWHQGRLIFGFLMLICGVIGFVLVLGGFVNAQGHDLALASVILFLLFFVGISLAAGGGWRRTLIIASVGTEFSWTAPHAIGKVPGPSMFDEVRVWAQKHGLPLDE